MTRKVTGISRAPIALIVTLLCCVPLGRALAGEAKSADVPAAPSLKERPIKADVEMVVVPVSVLDPSDRVVTGLSKDNFEIYEDKKRQEVSAFSTEDTPISVGVIFDTSGSMADKIEKSRMAINQFFRNSNPDDEFFVIAFNDRPEVVSHFSSNLDTLQSKLNFTEAKGRTSLLDAIYLGINEMRQAKYARKTLLIISDGGDNHSRYTDRDIRRSIREADIQMYAIGIYEPIDARTRTPEEVAGPGLLRELTEMTGGREFSIDSVDSLTAAALQVGREMRNVYVLGYSPADRNADGKWRKIQVKLRLPKGIPRLRLFTRSGYYAPLR
jgi:Ca-activated chloride channel homolog